MQPRRALITIMALVLLLAGIGAVPLQDDKEDSKFFQQTGHNVSGDFYAFYKSVPDAERLFGYPITEAIEDPQRSQVLLQYFQRVRMDYDPTKPAGERVTIADLGTWLYDETDRGDPPGFSVNTPMCRAFSNGRNVCYAFLQFYDRYDGEKIFGAPISDAEYVDGRLVQYFEHVRMEWRTEMIVGQRVVLTETGRIDFDRRIGNRELLKPVRPSTALPESRPLEIFTHAFVAQPLLASGQKQTIYILVNDQVKAPVEGAQINLTISYPDGQKDQVAILEATGSDGLTQYSFAVDGVKPNEVVQVSVETNLSNVPQDFTTTWFRIWW